MRTVKSFILVFLGFEMMIDFVEHNTQKQIQLN